MEKRNGSWLAHRNYTVFSVFPPFTIFPICEIGIWLMSWLSACESDLQARWFGIFIGLACGMVVKSVSCFFFSCTLRSRMVIFSILGGYSVGAIVDGFYVVYCVKTLAVFQWIPFFALGFLLVKMFMLKMEKLKIRHVLTQKKT
ncbi:MAG: hypothetical protein Q4C70_10360 [Planctomycetia bacterium]|nr:hypothetical protein [Planctomycetia bacterium]